jgi:ParB-like chromosome segregation protein Spo0J
MDRQTAERNNARSLLKQLEYLIAEQAAEEQLFLISEARAMLHSVSPQREQPVDFVRWVPLAKVIPNDYNPNSVARVEMGLLAVSILHDGYTQPIVTVYDTDQDTYIVVDGFHRYYSMKTNPEIMQRCHGLLPVVVIDKPVNDRMASTVRHNRARGKHSVTGMSNMVYEMLSNGWEDAAICNELGMSPEELQRLKHITGFSALFQNVDYHKAWMANSQLRIQKAYNDKVAAEAAKEQQ